MPHNFHTLSRAPSLPHARPRPRFTALLHMWLCIVCLCCFVVPARSQQSAMLFVWQSGSSNTNIPGVYPNPNFPVRFVVCCSFSLSCFVCLSFVVFNFVVFCVVWVFCLFCVLVFVFWLLVFWFWYLVSGFISFVFRCNWTLEHWIIEWHRGLRLFRAPALAMAWCPSASSTCVCVHACVHVYVFVCSCPCAFVCALVWFSRLWLFGGATPSGGSLFALFHWFVDWLFFVCVCCFVVLCFFCSVVAHAFWQMSATYGCTMQLAKHGRL